MFGVLHEGVRVRAGAEPEDSVGLEAEPAVGLEHAVPDVGAVRALHVHNVRLAVHVVPEHDSVLRAHGRMPDEDVASP